MALTLLLLAIVAEVAATIALRVSDGFSRLGPSVLVVGLIAVAYALFAKALQLGMTTSVAYGLWAALGVLLVAIIGSTFLGDQLTAVQYGGIVLVIAGVLALELGAASDV